MEESAPRFLESRDGGLAGILSCVSLHAWAHRRVVVCNGWLGPEDSLKVAYIYPANTLGYQLQLIQTSGCGEMQFYLVIGDPKRDTVKGDCYLHNPTKSQWLKQKKKQTTDSNGEEPSVRTI